MSEKSFNLMLLMLAELLAMSLWFSASAVVPQLTAEWKLAAADFAEALEINPAYHWPWLRAAPLLIEVGDLDGYREHCRAMLARALPRAARSPRKSPRSWMVTASGLRPPSQSPKASRSRR